MNKANASAAAARAKADYVNYQWNKIINTRPKYNVFHVALIVTVCTG